MKIKPSRELVEVLHDAAMMETGKRIIHDMTTAESPASAFEQDRADHYRTLWQNQKAANADLLAALEEAQNILNGEHRSPSDLETFHRQARAALAKAKQAQ